MPSMELVCFGVRDEKAEMMSVQSHGGGQVLPCWRFAHHYRQRRPEIMEINYVATILVVPATGSLENLRSFATSLSRFSKSPAFKGFAVTYSITVITSLHAHM